MRHILMIEYEYTRELARSIMDEVIANTIKAYM